MAAAHSFSKLSTANLVLQFNCRIRPSSYLPSKSLKNTDSSWLGTKVWLQPSTRCLSSHVAKHRPLVATVSSSLPTAKPERLSSLDKVPKWSSKAIKSFAMGELEARKLKYPTTGTEALLMGILIEGTSLASKFLRANGIRLLKVREETVKLLGKADLFFFSPEHPPLTEEAQRVLDWAVDQKIKSGEGGKSPHATYFSAFGVKQNPQVTRYCPLLALTMRKLKSWSP